MQSDPEPKILTIILFGIVNSHIIIFKSDYFGNGCQLNYETPIFERIHTVVVKQKGETMWLTWKIIWEHVAKWEKMLQSTLIYLKNSMCR